MKRLVRWMWDRLIAPRTAAAVALMLAAAWLLSIWHGVEWQSHSTTRIVLAHGAIGLDELAGGVLSDEQRFVPRYTAAEQDQDSVRRRDVPPVSNRQYWRPGDWSIHATRFVPGLHLWPTWGSVRGYGWLVLPIWPCAVAAGVWWWLWRARRMRAMPSALPADLRGARCARCGYDLSGTMSAAEARRCSECGIELSGATVVLPKDAPPRLVVWAMATISFVLRWVMILPAALAIVVWVLSMQSMSVGARAGAMADRDFFSCSDGQVYTWARLWTTEPFALTSGQTPSSLVVLPIPKPLESEFTFAGLTIRVRRELFTAKSLFPTVAMAIDGSSAYTWVWVRARAWLVAVVMSGVVVGAWGARWWRRRARFGATDAGVKPRSDRTEASS